MLMKKTQKPQYLHVKHQNTRKNMIKIGENTLFSDWQNIQNTFEVCWVDVISLFSDSKTDFNPLYRQILVRVKGDQNYHREIINFCTSNIKIQKNFRLAAGPLPRVSLGGEQPPAARYAGAKRWDFCVVFAPI